MAKEEQQKLVSKRDHIVIHRVTDNVIIMHNDGTEVYAVEIVRQPLVRCKECKECFEYEDGMMCMQKSDYSYDVEPDDYCSYGERRE